MLRVIALLPNGYVVPLIAGAIGELDVTKPGQRQIAERQSAKVTGISPVDKSL